MIAYQQLRIELVGASPLLYPLSLFNRAGKDVEVCEARRHHVYSSSIKKCLVDAARFYSDAKPTVVCGAVLMIGGTSPILRKGRLYTDATVGVHQESQHKWPMYDPWELDVGLWFNSSALTTDRVTELLTIAGHCVGIGVWRVEHGGEHGSFRVRSVEEREAVQIPNASDVAWQRYYEEQVAAGKGV